MRRARAFLHLVLLLTSAQVKANAVTESTASSDADPAAVTPNTTTAGTERATSSGTTSVASDLATQNLSTQRLNSKRPTSATLDHNTTAANRNKMDFQYILDVFLKNVQEPPVIIAFVIGVVLTALVWGLTALCCRSKRKNSLNVSETLEMVSVKDLKLSGQQDESTQTNGGAEGAEAGGPEVEYSDLDFSALKRQRAAEDVVRENTESEYAEIKKDTAEEGEGGEEEVKEEEKEDPPACEQAEADEQQSLWTGDTAK